MEQKYPNATPQELNDMSDRTCIICREEMVAPPIPVVDPLQPGAAQQQPVRRGDGPNDTPKKLPCGHVFHFHCLRSWLERQQSCPTWYAVAVRLSISCSYVISRTAVAQFSKMSHKQILLQHHNPAKHPYLPTSPKTKMPSEVSHSLSSTASSHNNQERQINNSRNNHQRNLSKRNLFHQLLAEAYQCLRGHFKGSKLLVDGMAGSGTLMLTHQPFLHQGKPHIHRHIHNRLQRRLRPFQRQVQRLPYPLRPLQHPPLLEKQPLKPRSVDSTLLRRQPP
jgi:hypothetical protein